MEILFNFAIWTGAVIFSLIKLIRFSRDIDQSLLTAEDFDYGWRLFVGRHRDVSDYEWRSWKALAFGAAPWLFFHVALSDYFASRKPVYRKLWYCLLPMTFVVRHFGWFAWICMAIQPVAYWATLLWGGRVRSVWLVSGAFLAAMNAAKYAYDADRAACLRLSNLGDDDFYLTLVSISWIQLRCISYCLDVVRRKSKFYLIDLLSYCFYLPLLFLGPVIQYENFEKSFMHPTEVKFSRRLFCLAVNLSRYLGWALLLESSVHFIYFNAMQYHLDIMENMPDWCLYGGGVWMGLYFYLKYLVTYGIAGSLVAVDNVVPETPPLCIARVHLYSQMWRYFDVGLHKFLIKYLYGPIVDGVRSIGASNVANRLLGSSVCFLFVLFWHGVHKYIIVWTALNFVGIVIENVGVFIAHSASYKRARSRYFKDDDTKNRLYAVLSTPVLIGSALSNFYFFAGSEIGRIYVDRVLSQRFYNFVGMFVCIYSCCRSSQYFMNVRAREIKVK